MFLIKLQCLICCKLSVFILFDCIIQMSEHHHNLHIIMKLHTNVTSKMVVILLISNCKCTGTGPVQELNPGPLNLNELYHVYGATQQSIWCQYSSWFWPSHNKQFYNIFFGFDQCCHCDPIFYNQNASFFHNIHLSTLLV